MTRIIFLIALLASTTSFAQQLWGTLAQSAGPHEVGFKIIRERDKARGNRPMLVSVWYPARSSASGKPVLFKDYLTTASGSDEKTAYERIRRTLELPFVSGGQKIPGDALGRLLQIPTAAKWDVPEAAGKFPAVLMNSETESLSVTAEFLASNGFVVAAVNAPYGSNQPPDSLLWVQPTADLQWLMNYTRKLKNVDQSKLSALGFGGGIQGAFFLTMKTDAIKALVNLEGGVFGPRSLTDKSVEYHPEKIKSPILHIVTRSQQVEDAVGQQQALVNTKLNKAYIQNGGLRHHDFSIFGRLLNNGLNMRGDLSDVAEQTYVAAHKVILEFLKLVPENKVDKFVIDDRYMPLIALDNYINPGPPFNLVLHQPEMDDVIVEKDRIYKKVRDTTLVYDIFYPQGFDKKSQLPVVAFVNGIGNMDLYRWKIYQDWARLVAANGMIGVTYQARRNHEIADLESLMDYLALHSNELAVNKDKFGLWACSANVTTGLPVAMKESSRVKALAAYYGMTQVPSFRQDVEIQVVRAGLDFISLNEGIENFVKAALLQDLHFEYINYPEGQHAFDAFDDTPRSREIILQTIDFFKRILSKDHMMPSKKVLTTSAMRNALRDPVKVDETLKEWKQAVAMYRGMGHSYFYNHLIDERSLNQLGYELLGAGKTTDAIKVFTANQEEFPQSPNAYDALADAYEKAGDNGKAVANARKALEKLSVRKDLPPQFSEAIRTSAEDKIRRLK